MRVRQSARGDLRALFISHSSVEHVFQVYLGVMPRTGGARTSMRSNHLHGSSWNMRLEDFELLRLLLLLHAAIGQISCPTVDYLQKTSRKMRR